MKSAILDYNVASIHVIEVNWSGEVNTNVKRFR